MHLGIVFVEGAARVVGSRQGDGPLARKVHFQDWVDDQQGGIAIVALYVQIVQVLGAVGISLQVFVLVTLPGVDAEILGIVKAKDVPFMNRPKVITLIKLIITNIKLLKAILVRSGVVRSSLLTGITLTIK